MTLPPLGVDGDPNLVRNDAERRAAAASGGRRHAFGNQAEHANRYVVFADVLAFRTLVRRNEHRRLVDIFVGDVRLIAEVGATAGVALPGRRGVPDTDVAVVNMRMVSDSIVLWTDSDRPAEFTWLLVAMRNVLKVGMATGVPVRAAMAHGELTHVVTQYETPRIGSDTLIGRALLDAYEAERCQQWAGGVVLDSATANFEASAGVGVPTVSELVERGLLSRYEVPVKGNGTVGGLAVNWPASFDTPLTVGLLEWAFTEYGKTLDDESARQKFENTVRFVSNVGLLTDAAG